MGHSKSILVVEDDLNMQELIIDYLEDEAYHVVGASNTDDAISYSSKYDFDLVVTDVRMAGMDGVDGFRLLKKRFPKLKCIVISGWPGSDAASRAISIEVDEWIAKPFSMDHLLGSVSRVLNSDSRASQFLTMLHQAPIKLMTITANFFKRDVNASLNRARDRAFLALHTAIKSSYIPSRTASILFSSLAKCDRDYRECLSKPSEELRNRLTGNYNDVFSKLKTYAQTKSQPLGQPEIPATEFRAFYDAVRDGEVAPDDFKLAPVLRDIPMSELVKSPHLMKLRKIMWGSS